MTYLRLGSIEYQNTLPINYRLKEELERRLAVEEYRLIFSYPSELNRMLGEGELDLAFVSSIYYALHADSFLILPGLSISSAGQVKSVLLFSTRPLEQVKRVALPHTSATSINMLQILLEELSRYQVEYIHTRSSLEEMLAGAEAALLIGDQALQAREKARDLKVFDLGQLWFQHTGEVMVYALWVLSSGVESEQPRRLAAVHRSLLAARDWGLSHLEEIQRASSLEDKKAEDYYRHLGYRLDEAEKRGLKTFYQEAFRAGLLSEPVKPLYWRERNE